MISLHRCTPNLKWPKHHWMMSQILRNHPWILQCFYPPHLRKWTSYTSKSSWSITQSERHFSVYKGAIRTSNCGLLMIFWCYRNLIIPWIPIQKAVMWMSNKSFLHLINERKGKVIISKGVVEFVIVDANSSTCDCEHRNQLVVVIRYYYNSYFFDTTYTELTQ